MQIKPNANRHTVRYIHMYTVPTSEHKSKQVVHSSSQLQAWAQVVVAGRWDAAISDFAWLLLWKTARAPNSSAVEGRAAVAAGAG
jgi:hypothetical protein